MTSERRQDPTWTAIRQNWPILALAAAGLITWGQMVYKVQDLQNDVAALQDRLSLKALTDFARWQVGIERDVAEIRKGCRP